MLQNSLKCHRIFSYVWGLYWWLYFREVSGSNSGLLISHLLRKRAFIFTACILCSQTLVYTRNNDNNAFRHLRTTEWASDNVYVCMNGVLQVTSVSEIHQSSYLRVSIAWHNYIISVTLERIFHTEYYHYYILRRRLSICIGYIWMSYLVFNTYHFRHIRAVAFMWDWFTWYYYLISVIFLHFLYHVYIGPIDR